MQISLLQDIKMGAIVDVETTGMSPRRGDEVVEIGIILFRFNAVHHDEVEVVETYQALREPTDQIPFSVTRIHGITNEMVLGKTLDYTKMESIFGRAEFVVAHNASFDRSFLEHLVPMSIDRPWKCSCFGIPWKKHGLENRRLGTIRDFFGIAHDEAHRALADCEVVLEALKRPRYLQDLLK
jgi:DNA polymerase-3 subunit epsilon